VSADQDDDENQGCQMVFFALKIPNLVYWNGQVWNILLPFGIFNSF
jgi:hypothetical protein